MVQVCLCLYHPSVTIDGSAESGACQVFINVAWQQNWSHKSIYPSTSQSNHQLVWLLMHYLRADIAHLLLGLCTEWLQEHTVIGYFRLDRASGGLQSSLLLPAQSDLRPEQVAVCIWHLGTWASVDLAMLSKCLDFILRVFFQPKWLYDSVDSPLVLKTPKFGSRRNSGGGGEAVLSVQKRHPNSPSVFLLTHIPVKVIHHSHDRLTSLAMEMHLILWTMGVPGFVLWGSRE